MMSTLSTGRDELVAARKRSRGLIGWAFTFSIFVNLLMLVGPLFMLQVYDRVLASGSEATLVALFVLVAALYALMAVLDFARGRIMFRTGARFQEALDERVFDAVLRRAILPKERTAPAKALQELQSIQGALASPGMMALMDFPWVPIFISALFLFHPMLGWLGVAGSLVLIALAFASQLLSRRRLPEMRIASAQAHHMAEQARQQVETVRAQGLTGQLTKRWARMRVKAQQHSVAHSDVVGGFQSVTKTFRMFLQSAMLAAGAWLVLQAELSAGAMIAGSILLGRALAPVEQALGQLKVLQGAAQSWKSLAALLSATPPAAPKTALPCPDARLQASNLAVCPVGAATPVLHGVDFAVAPGTALGLVGPSGSGKSSLIRTLVGIWPAQHGEVRLSGARLDQYNDNILGSHIGYLPQEVEFFPGSIAENIARMADEPDEAEVVRAAQAACCHELILSLPQGYDTPVKGGDAELSGGQRQRIALARALYGNPVLLVLDEPNSALDAEGQMALNQAINKMKADGKAVVISSHQPASLGVVDHLIVLGKGTVLTQGPRDEVLKSMMAAVEGLKKAVTARETTADEATA
jgi:PrtD family type I secretion system ABC transporter